MPITDFGADYRPVRDSIASKLSQLPRVNHNGRPITATDEAVAEALDQIADDTLDTLDQADNDTATTAAVDEQPQPRTQPRPDPSQGAGHGSAQPRDDSLADSLARKSAQLTAPTYPWPTP